MASGRNLHEAKRLASLYRYNVLDTPPEESFDRITRLAKHVMQVPITLISLVDEHRQWFKSKQGLDVCETDRDISFCTHAIQDEKPFIIPDALADDRFRKNPLVTGEPHIRFYLGIPLKVSDGSCIGTLCAIDQKPRNASRDQIAALYDLARLAVEQLELRQIATTDPLTGLLNLRGFTMEVEKKRASDELGQNSHITIIDIDDFELIGSSYGHAASDIVLQNLASLCRSRLSPHDCFARLGEGEFAVISRDKAPDKVVATADELRNSISLVGTPFEERMIDITVSIAVASFDPRHDAVPALIKNAANILQNCRVKGGNKIAVLDKNPQVPKVA